MCGIFGIIGPNPGDDAPARALAVIRHRGPESEGIKRLPGATLAHVRLRVIDLSPAGAQPMSNEDESVWTTFNGEIYNFADLRRQLEGLGHKFRSASDTEVLVHGYEQWGDAVVERLDGMFAFAIWDVKRQRLLLARDRTGKKPLFYGERGGRFYFASEIKALFAAGVPIEVDPAGVVGFLAYGYAPSPGTMYKGVQQLPAGSLLVLEPGGQPRVSTYWRFDFTPSAYAPSEADASAQIRTLLTEAVRKRLVADVPVGAFLSGGLDSTIIVGLMARLGHRAKTFSIGFADDPRYDETRYARIAARAFDTDHTEFHVKPSDLEIIEKLVWHHDGPFGDSSAIPTYVVSRLTRSKVTVALTGDGGDELFAGYLRFWAGRTTEAVPSALRGIAGRLGGLIPSGTGSRSLGARARRMLTAMKLDLGDRLIGWNSFFALQLAEVLQPDLMSHAGAVLSVHRRYFDNEGASPLTKALNHNFGTYLPFDLLVKMDRMSMAHALETRSPFLDTALIEYVSRLPDDYKLHGRTTKYILRRAFSDLVPDEIQRRGKMGFGVPLGSWFRDDLKQYVSDHLAGPHTHLHQFIRPEATQRVLSQHMAGAADYEHQIWALLTMEIWLRNLDRLAQPWETALPTEREPAPRSQCS